MAFDRHWLSNILKEQIAIYKQQYIGNNSRCIDSDIEIFEKANDFYCRVHPDRYRILWKLLEPEISEEPAFISKIQKKYKSKLDKYDKKRDDEICYATTKEIEDVCKDILDDCDPDEYDRFLEDNYIDVNPDDPFSNSDIILSRRQREDYLLGDYIVTGECGKNTKKNGLQTIINNPNLLFYTLARATALDEETIIMAFYEMKELDVYTYNTYCVSDIIDYYYKKMGCPVKDIIKDIKESGYKNSTVSALLNGAKEITFIQFMVLSEALRIPEKWVNFCLYRLAQKEDQFSYRAGYEACVDDLRDHPDEMLSTICSATPVEEAENFRAAVDWLLTRFERDFLTDVFPHVFSMLDGYDEADVCKMMFHCLYKFLGYRFTPDIFSEQADNSQIPSVSIRRPGGAECTMPVEGYNKLLREIISYTKCYLDKEFIQ